MTQDQWLQLNMRFLLDYSGSNETWWELLGYFYLQGMCECVWGAGANCQIAEGGHLWPSPAGKTLQEELLNMYFDGQIFINKNLHNFCLTEGMTNKFYQGLLLSTTQIIMMLWQILQSLIGLHKKYKHSIKNDNFGDIFT